MTLSDYDPKLLEFLYELTKLKKVMSYKEIARNIKIRGESVSAKTVERWFSYLRKSKVIVEDKEYDKFLYFPKFYYEKLGLRYIYVMIEDPDKDILEKFPFAKYQNYALWLYDFNLRKEILTIAYPLPVGHISKFKQHWQKAKDNKLIKSYRIHEVYSSFMIYSTWHKVLDNRGIFHPSLNDENEIDRQLKDFEYYLNNLPEVKLASEIRKDPLIIPVLFEHHLEAVSSQSLWNELTKNLGASVWDYIPWKKERTDGAGIKRVQRSIKHIDKSNLLQQMKMTYLLTQLDNSLFYITVSFKNKSIFLKSLRKLAMNTIQLSVYPMESNKAFLIAITDQKNFSSLIESLASVKINDLLLLQHEKSLPLLANKGIYRFNYKDLFDPKKLSWK